MQSIKKRIATQRLASIYTIIGRKTVPRHRRKLYFPIQCTDIIMKDALNILMRNMNGNGISDAAYVFIIAKVEFE